MHKRLFGVEAKKVGGDTGYAGTDNRDYCKENGIQTSFGTQKEHYDLRRVKARTKLTEILYIFFGIHTANVVQLVDRIEQRAQLAAS